MILTFICSSVFFFFLQTLLKCSLQYVSDLSRNICSAVVLMWNFKMSVISLGRFYCWSRENWTKGKKDLSVHVLTLLDKESHCRWLFILPLKFPQIKAVTMKLVPCQSIRYSSTSNIHKINIDNLIIWKMDKFIFLSTVHNVGDNRKSNILIVN